jgi:hypothetical protein
VGGKSLMKWLGLSTSRSVQSVEKQQNLRQHLLILSIIFVAVTIIYANVTRAYFCAYDDFDNLHQTVFEDADQPARMLTTSHFNSFKYRPGHRAINLFTYLVGDDDSTAFRVRNLAFHLVNAVLVYALAWQLFRSFSVSGAGALLFGLHPLANQTVVGAIWTNTVAHTGFLLALVLFIASTRAKRYWSLWLIGALISASFGLFTYDPEIIVFGLMLLYFLLFVAWRGEAIRMPYIVLFTSVSSILIGSYFILRKLVVPNGWQQVSALIPSPIVVGKNAMMYVIALVNPVDVVLANELFNTPLPSEIRFTNATLVLGIALALLLTACIGVYLPRLKHTANRGNDWPVALFLVSGIWAPLLPMLAFASRPSETYLYLSVAFYVLLLVYFLSRVLHKSGKPKFAFYVSVVFLAGIFSAATWVKNDRVSECGETVHRILHNLPENLLRKDYWMVAFANVPGEKSTRRYGFYGFRGVDTIGEGLVADGAVTHALQLVFRNKLLSGKVVKSEELPSMCSQTSASRNLCVFVHWDGKIETCCSSAIAPVS